MMRFHDGHEIMLFSILNLFADFDQSVTNNTLLKYVSACILMVKS